MCSGVEDRVQGGQRSCAGAAEVSATALKPSLLSHPQRHVAMGGGGAHAADRAACSPSLPAAEADAAARGIRRLVLLTTRTADWFEQRGFKPAGAAHLSQLLPEERRQRIDPSRNSQLFSKLVGAGGK